MREDEEILGAGGCIGDGSRGGSSGGRSRAARGGSLFPGRCLPVVDTAVQGE